MKRLLALTLLVPALLSGCTNAERAHLFSYGSKHTVHVYSGGVEVGHFESTGKLISKEGGGYFFQDDRTGKLVEVYGTIIVEQN